MRSYSAAFTAERGKASTSPIYVLEVEWGGGIGTKYYSDVAYAPGGGVTVTEAIANLSDFTSALAEEKGQISDISISLLDPSRTIFGYADSVAVQACKCTLYQQFAALAWAQKEKIYSGIVRGIKWSESDFSTVLDITDRLSWYNRELGYVADKSIFSEIGKEDENRVFPIVIGRCERVPAVLIDKGPETTLSVGLLSLDQTPVPTDHDTVVEDSREFAQDSALDLWIGLEKVTGSFHGRKLNLTARERTILTTTTTAASTSADNFICSNMTPAGFFWVGLRVEIAVSWGGGPAYIDHKIIWYRSADRYYKDQMNGWFTNHTIPSGTAINRIYGPGYQKPMGTRVRAYQTEYNWALCQEAVQHIERVEMRGEAFYTVENSESAQRGIKSWLTIPEDWYSIGTEIWGGPHYTILTMGFLPDWNPEAGFEGNQIYADIVGSKSNDGNSYNPAGLIKKLCVAHLGFESTDFDSVSYNAAVTKTDWMRIGFYLDSVMRGLDLIYDIAFQCRLSLHWEQGILHFKYLENERGGVTWTATDNIRELGFFEIEEEDSESMCTRVQYTWREAGEEKKREIVNTAAELVYPKKVKQLNLWCHNKEAYATSIAKFYLNRWSHLYRKARFRTFLNRIEAERGDWITMTFTGLLTSQPAEILSVKQVPGSGQSGQIDLLEIEARIPIEYGCGSSCESTGESGCDDGCELHCMTGTEVACNYSCESLVQEPCQLVCVTQCQMQAVSCTATCQTACQTACELQGQETGCDSTGTEGCATCEGDETCGSCITTEEIAPCEGGCGELCGNCESCETTCQACQTACQATCEVCEFGGCTDCTEGGCSACETLCQTSCQLCEFGGCADLPS